MNQGTTVLDNLFFYTFQQLLSIFQDTRKLLWISEEKIDSPQSNSQFRGNER